jgi:phenylpropionate dioxygenase-like ring-hydroxylating dioxygenase large terminal subunit
MSITHPARLSELSAHAATLLERTADGLDRGRIPMAIFGDPDLYALELRNVFNRSWVFVAHESEIAKSGDFVRRYIGDGAWIITRDKAGAIHALFDACRHRGAQLCRADQGNANTFRCPYHGWTFRNDGALIGVPFHAQAFKTLDFAASGLWRAPHIENYGGFIFVNLDPDARPFREHLGDFAWYFDMQIKLFGGGWEVAGPPSRWRVRANWKTGAENSTGDSYHTVTLHRSIVEMGLIATFDDGRYDVHITECSGHSMMMRRTAPGEELFYGNPPALRALMSTAGLTPAQVDLQARALAHVGTIFPNFSFLHQIANDDPLKKPVSMFSIAQWQPRSATETEVIRWVLVPKDASAEYKERSFVASTSQFGPAGYFEQDDMIVWAGAAQNGSSSYAADELLDLNYEMGLPGKSDAAVIPDWPGPGTVYDSRLEEGVLRTFLRSWVKAMTP